MKNKTRMDFQVAAYQDSLDEWIVSVCQKCSRYYKFYFEGEDVFFCGCEESDRCHRFDKQVLWSDIADYYNEQTDPETIKEMNKFWGFTDE